jgi:excisionase family DNA binding protein
MGGFGIIHTMDSHPPDAERLLTPSEVAKMFRVVPKTVTRWAQAGKISSIRTLGGHRRFREAEVRRLLEEGFGSEDESRVG